MATPLVLQVTCVVMVLIVGFGEIIPLAEAEIPCGTMHGLPNRSYWYTNPCTMLQRGKARHRPS